MNKRVEYAEGIVGVNVQFNHSEMIVLKGMAERASINAAKTGRDMKNEDVEEVKSMLTDLEQFITNILPENVVSLDGAYNSLFKPEIV